MIDDHIYKILIVIRWPIGGIRTFIRYVYREFDPSKYHFTIIAPDENELNILMEDLKELNVSIIPICRKATPFQFAKAIFNTILKNKFDLVHSHGLTAGTFSMVSLLFSDIPHILTIHETISDEIFRGVIGYLKKYALNIILSMIDVIHSVSNDAQENLLDNISILRMFKKKLIVISNGIETDRFLITERRNLRNELNLTDDTFLIGFLGRFMPEKGFNYLVDALELVIKRNILLTKPYILAFGENEAFIREEKKHVRDKQLERYVFFMPFTSNVASTLRGLDVVVMPSLREACGLLAMEAMVAGVPLIGSDCIGLRETITGTQAQMITARDSVLLSNAIIKEMEHSSKKQAEDFRIEAAQRYCVKKQAKQLENLILSYIKKK